MAGANRPPTTWNQRPTFARVFARLDPAMDAQGVAEHCRALLAGLADRVLTSRRQRPQLPMRLQAEGER